MRHGFLIRSQILVLFEPRILNHPAALNPVTPDKTETFRILKEGQQNLLGEMVQHGRHRSFEFPGVAGNPAVDVLVGDTHGEQEAVRVIF